MCGEVYSDWRYWSHCAVCGNTPGTLRVLCVIMEYGSTPYVGLTPIKHGRHTLVQILFFPKN